MRSSGRPFGFTFTFYWSPDHNVPILNPRLVHKVSSFYLLVKPTEPGDVRPAFPYDILIIREAIFREFQCWEVVDLLIPRNSLVLLNKVPGYPDEADEVIVNGEVVGHRWFDPETCTWRFRPIFQGAAKMLEQKVGYYAIVDLPKLTRGYEIHRTHIVQAELPPKKGMLVVVQTQDGKWQGLAKLVRNRRLYIIKAWKAVKPTYVETRSSWKDVIEINENVLENFEERSKKFIKKIYQKYSSARKIVVSYSGGKDSLVVLSLALDVLRDNFYTIFNDTTLELPDTYVNVHEVENRLGIEIHWARAETDFKTIINILYPPSRDFRYCCKMLKLAPISKLLKKLAPTGSVSIVGQRKFESSLRARLPRIAPSKWVANTIVAAPIDDWTSLHVWLYIFKHNLPYNIAYEKGFDRIGCWACPANELAELYLARYWYTELYEWLNETLTKVKNELALPEYWLKVGLWRWREKYPGDVRKYIERTYKVNEDSIKNLCEYYREKMRLIDVLHDKESVTIKLVKRKRKLDVRDIINLSYTLNKITNVSVSGDNSITLNVKDIGTISIKVLEDENSIYVILDKLPQKDVLIALVRILARLAYCTSCRLCESWCNNEALRIDKDRIRISLTKCKRCNLCNIVCPVAEYLVARSGLLKKIDDIYTCK